MTIPTRRPWAEGLAQRQSWQQTAYSQADLVTTLPNIRTILERRA